jgi:MscS family membrane protein
VTLTVLEKLNFPHYTIKWGGITFNSNFRVLHTSLQEILQAGGVIILILSFVWVLLRIIDFLALVMEKRSGVAAGQADHQLIVFFKDFFKVILAIIGLLLILKFGFGWNIANLVTGLSIVGAAIALATRESLENLIASFIIFFDKPFATGDLVKVQQITGTVEKIGLRSTRIRTEQKTYVTVPNKQMVDSIMDNLSMRSHRRALLLLEFHSSNGVTPIESFIEETRKILGARAPEIETYSVYLTDIQKNAFVVQVEFFSPALEIGAFNKLREEVGLAVLKLIETRQLRLIQKEPGEAVS